MEHLRKIIELRDGVLYWLPRDPADFATIRTAKAFATRCAGKPISLTPEGCGYLQFSSKKKNYRAHRVIFFLHYGFVPDRIDHIDGNILNNSPENLRPANHSENMQNCKRRYCSNTGIKGVSYVTRTKKYLAQVECNNERVLSMSFDDIELAELVVVEARNLYHGSFARHV